MHGFCNSSCSWACPLGAESAFAGVWAHGDALPREKWIPVPRPGQGTVSCHTMLGHLCGTVRNSGCREATWEYTGGCGLPPLEVTPHICLQTSSSASIVHYYTECCKPLYQPSDACASAPAAEKRLCCHTVKPKVRLMQEPPLQTSGCSNTTAFFSSEAI